MDKLSKKELIEARRLERIQLEAKQKEQATLKKAGIGVLAGVIIVASIWGLVAFSNKADQAEQAKSVPPPTLTDQTVGPKDAKVTLIEYSDFQCPACASYYPLVKQLTQEYQDRILFVYRYFPLANAHKNAMASSQAAYAAGLQGKFWIMHDKLFETQKEWENLPNAMEKYIQYASDLGLDPGKFIQDQGAATTQKAVEDSLNQGLAIGVNSTPTFYLNGELISNPQSYKAFKSLIDEKLTASK